MAGYKHLEIPGNFQQYVLDKKESAKAYYRYFLARLSRMFQYKNLPDTIPHEIMDRYLFNNGIACITKYKDELYCFYGNAGGAYDPYYRPSLFIVANPHLIGGTSVNIKVFDTPLVDQPYDMEGVLIRNDSDWIGLCPLLSRYSYLMAENILTLRTADVMLRITALLSAPSDKEYASAVEYLRSMEKGILGVIGENPFFDGIRLQSPPSNNGSYLTQFIEYQQYLKGSLYNEIGLSANYNMKREAIGEGESSLGEDVLLPLAENMLLCRREDLKKVNEMFGTDISVDFSSSWLENEIEAISSLKELEQPQSNGFFGQPGQPTSLDYFGNPGQPGDVSGGLGNLGETGDVSEGLGETGQPGQAGQPVGTGDEKVENDGVDGADGERDGKVLGEVPDSEPEPEENEESKINDTATETPVTEIYESIKKDDEEPEPISLGKESEDVPEESESSEDKGDISDN